MLLFAASADLTECKWAFTLVFQKAFSLLCPTYQTGTEYLSDTVRSPLLWNHKAENHHPSDIFHRGNGGNNSWLSWHLEVGRLRLRDKTEVVGSESRGSTEQVFFSFFLTVVERIRFISPSCWGTGPVGHRRLMKPLHFTLHTSWQGVSQNRTQ